MQLQGYQRMDVVPWESASGGQGVQCPASSQRCDAAFISQAIPAHTTWMLNISIRTTALEVTAFYVGDRLVDEWLADAHLPSNKPDADSSTRQIVRSVANARRGSANRRYS